MQTSAAAVEVTTEVISVCMTFDNEVQARAFYALFNDKAIGDFLRDHDVDPKSVRNALKDLDVGIKKDSASYNEALCDAVS